MKQGSFRWIHSATILAATLQQTLNALPTLDAFDYTLPANLPGQTNPDGLTWAAAGPAGPPITVEAGNLAVQALQPPAGNLIRIGNVVGPDARFPLGVAVQDNVIYYSVALQVKELGAFDTNGSVIAFLHPDSGPSPNSVTNGGAALLLRATGAGGFQVGTVKTSTNRSDFVWAPSSFTTNEVVFVVARYTFTPGGMNNDEVRLWVNPSLFTFGGPAPGGGLSSTAGPDVPQIQSWVVLQRPGGALPAVTLMDELRVGYTYAQVTPPGPRDFGDAPASNATLQADNGPRHLYQHESLPRHVD